MISFELGQLVITDGAQAVLTTLGMTPLQLITRHRKHEAKQANHIALSVGGALHSSYTLGVHIVCITTNPQRSMTTILLADEVASHTSLFSPLS